MLFSVDFLFWLCVFFFTVLFLVAHDVHWPLEAFDRDEQPNMPQVLLSAMQRSDPALQGSGTFFICIFSFFFLKRNVSHLGFIFVFSEDYFLFSPFSFFWEDRLFTVDYRQKCCSPSYETAFFFPQEEVLLHLFSQIPLLVQADSASAQQPEVADACKWGGTCAADICWGPQMLTQVGEQSYNTKRLKFSKFCSTTEEIFWSHSAFQTAQIFAEAVLVCRGYRENNYLSPRNVSSN